MKILAIFHNCNWEKPNLLPSLSKIGEVEWYDYSNDFLKILFYKKIKILRRIKRKIISHNIENKFLKKASNSQYDFIFWYISGEYLDKDTARKFFETGIPSVNISLDDMEGKFYNEYDGRQWSGVADICGYFSLNWAIENSVVPEYKKKNAPVVVMQMGVNPEYYRPLDIEKEYDVVFVGSKNRIRQEIIDSIKNCGINIGVFGKGWNTRILSEREIVETYNKSKIVLGIAAFDGRANRPAMKGRDFEVLATGTFYITQYHKQISDIFEEGKEIEYYRDNEELLQKIRFYLDNEKKRNDIAIKGYNNVIGNHTWEKRLRDIIKRLGIC